MKQKFHNLREKEKKTGNLSGENFKKEKNHGADCRKPQFMLPQKPGFSERLLLIGWDILFV